MKIFSIIRSLEDVTKTKVLNCDGEIITFLFEKGPSRPSEIISYSRHSSVQVFNKLKEMTAFGIIDKLHEHDGRNRFYKLNEAMIIKIKAASGLKQKFLFRGPFEEESLRLQIP